MLSCNLYSEDILTRGLACEGDWEAAEQRAAAGPDEAAGSDDEVFGDFEDMEAGMTLSEPVFSANVTCSPQQAVSEET